MSKTCRRDERAVAQEFTFFLKEIDRMQEAHEATQETRALLGRLAKLVTYLLVDSD